MCRLVIVCGEPGVGKSRVSRHIAEQVDGTRLATDEIRKELFGAEPNYTWQESKTTYDELFGRTERLLQDGDTCVLDGTFMLKRGRKRAKHLAETYTTSNSIDIVRVTAEDTVVKERITERENDISDAGFKTYQSIRDRFEPVMLPHTVIDNSSSWQHTVDEIASKDL